MSVGSADGSEGKSCSGVTGAKETKVLSDLKLASARPIDGRTGEYFQKVECCQFIEREFLNSLGV